MEVLFSRPSYLYFLLVIPLIIIFNFFVLKIKRRRALQFSNFEAIARVKGVEIYSKSFFPVFLMCLIVLLLTFSLAGTSLAYESQISSFSFVIALDNSGSMGAKDFSPSRLEAAKEIAINFVNSLPTGTHIGVISFSGNAFINQEVSDDKKAVIDAISGINLAQIGGTDLAEAIVTSSNLLEKEENKAVILLSDGQANVGNLNDAVAYALQKNVRVYTIGIGTEEGGKTSFGFSKIDEEALKSIAYETKGEFFLVKNKEELSDTFKKISNFKLARVIKNISNELLILVLILFVFLYFYKELRFVFPF